MIVTTTPTIEGHEVQRYCGIVFAKVIWWGS
ncbi:MAG: heavy metal-binding domain-containing protein, partial [Planctomyces sp.]